MPIDAEIARLKQRVRTQREDLLPKASARARSSPFLSPFEVILQKYFATLEATLETRLRILQTDLADEIQISTHLAHIQHHLDHVHYFLTEVLNAHDKVPSELYYLADWFFDYPPGLRDHLGYIFCLRRTLSTISFKEIISARFQDLYPELDQELRTHSFHFIFLPPIFLEKDHSIEWPLIFHEFAHIIEDDLASLNPEFPGLPPLYFELIELGNQNHPDAILKLHAIELVADYIALRRCGPIFLRRYYQNYGALGTFFEPSVTHPANNVRLAEGIMILANEGHFHAASRTIRDEAVAAIGAGVVAPFPPSGATIAAANVRTAIAPLIPVYRREDYEEDLAGLAEATLLADLTDLKPVIRSPACLFTLVTFFDKVHEDERYQRLVADCLRLWLIQNKFPGVITH